MSQISCQSGRASPGASTALLVRVAVRSELMDTPSDSAHSAAGKSMSAYSLVAVARNASCAITSSARRSPSTTFFLFATEATGFVQIIQHALMFPAAIWANMSTVPVPNSARMEPGGSCHRFSTKSRSAGDLTDRWPGRPGPMYPISLPPIAFGCPVNENGPLPGRQIAPVARCRLQIALVFQVPWVLWFRPIVHSVIHSRASPIHRAAVRMSSSASPVIAATTAGA
ncbi:Uncharacterised protein [Mycobacteroides abscessus subsp. abscessus]|nr:Uncharacterised protein [Mycobacteroides abscessus subsp. abscessus]